MAVKEEGFSLIIIILYYFPTWKIPEALLRSEPQRGSLLTSGEANFGTFVRVFHRFLSHQYCPATFALTPLLESQTKVTIVALVNVLPRERSS